MFGFSGGFSKSGTAVRQSLENCPVKKIKQRKITKLIKTKVRRGKRKSLKTFKKSLRFLGINASGLKSKTMTFKKVLAELQPSVFFIQETMFKHEGQLKLGNNFIVYELLRQNRNGGGLAEPCVGA